jgi:hypothetical protein
LKKTVSSHLGITISRFRKGLDNKKVLSEMAQLSFRYLGNFKYHIITCDKQGSVLLFPDPHARNNYSIYHAPAVFNKPTIVDSPLGSGDILTAVFAAHYDKSVSKKDDVDASTMAVKAFQAAHEAAGAYCGMPWHQMPSKRDIELLEKQDLVWMEKPKIQVSGALRFLPKDSQIDLKPYATAIPQMYSKSKKLCDELDRLVKNINESHHHHFLVGAPSGFGKSIIIKNLHQVLDDTDATCINGNELASFANSDHSAIERLFEDDQFKKKYRLVLVDEAYHEDTFKRGAQGKPLLIFMDEMLDRNLRFVFFDSHFYRRDTKKIDLMSDINSRCGAYEFEGILDRPMDIPLMLASAVVNSPEMNKYTTIRISGKVLLFAASEIIEDGNPRKAMNCIKKACEQSETRGDATIDACDYPCSENNIAVPNGLIEEYYVILHK